MADKLGLFILKGSDMSKTASRLMKLVDLAAVLVMKGDKILLAWNDKWGSFTLPMSKRREWKDPEAKEGSQRTEEWEEAAVRAAAEWMGRTITEKPEVILDMAEFQQSDRDASWKRYHVLAFEIAVGDDDEPAAGRLTEWLTADEIVDESRRPISPTARHIVAELKLKAIL